MGNDNNEIKEKEETKVEETKAEEVKTEEPKVEEPKKEEPKKEEPKKEEPKTAPAPELDESDDGLETVDLNATDYNSKSDKYSEGISLNGHRNQDNPNKHDSGKSSANSEEHRPVRKREKKQVDQYKQKRIRKRIRLIVILAILVGVGFLVYFKVIKPAREAANAFLNQMKEQTDTVERRDITQAITTTGTFEASDSHTITSTARDTTIDAVMAKVGDHVNQGDTMVLFSTENINKTITQLQEDLAKQKKKDAITSQANDRTYLFTYANQSTELSSAADKVDSALKALYEACNGYGDAKRALQAAKDEGASEAEISMLQSSVNQAYQIEQERQNNYDAAVDAQAVLIARTGNTLTEADENKMKTEITLGDEETRIARQIEEYQDKLENYVITAPISGIVTNVSVEEGNGFSGGNVMVIQNTDSFKIKALIDEYDITDIKLGQRVIIKTDATRDDELVGYVSFIAPTSTSTMTVSTTSSVAATSNGVTSSVTSSVGNRANYEISINVITKDDRIKIGMSAKLNIIVDQVSNVFTVPYDAISTNAQGENYITILEDKPLGAGTGNAADKKDSKGDMPILTVNGENVSENTEKPDKSDFAGGGFMGKGSDKSGAEDVNQNRRDIKVKIGMEGDYYTEVISDELKEGMTVVIPDSGQFNGFDFSQVMVAP